MTPSRFETFRADVELLAVARRLGANLKRSGGEWVGPCPVCGGRDRFAINPARGVWNCRGCDVGGDAIDLVRHALRCDFREAADFVGRDVSAPPTVAPRLPEAEANRADDAKRMAAALAVWAASVDPRGSPVERYLASRGLDLGDDVAGEVLRWSGRAGAMVALFRNVRSGEPQAISRTFLDSAGSKIGRKFLGPVGGAAVMLDGFADVEQGLHLGEGVETCLAARQLWLRPCWAAGSSGAIAAFPVLGRIEALTLLSEHDDASARAVEGCATRWHTAGREVFINTPLGGKDLNDALRAAA